MGRSKVNHLCHSLVGNRSKIQKSVGYHHVERKERIAKMCTLCEFVPVFGGSTLKCAPYNFNGALVFL